MTETKNKIICGDCLDVLKTIDAESIDLIYLDPPFSSDKEYTGIWLKTEEEVGFDDKHWRAGVKDYIVWLQKRIEECHRVLKPTGTIYIHCDFHAGHYIKEMMDEIFGYNNFISEIVWRRKTQSATITSNTRSFGNNHDTILFYSKTKEYFFKRLTTETEVSPKEYLHDANGYFKTAPADGEGQYCKETLNKMVKNGGAYLTKNKRIRKKTYLLSKNGKLYDIKPVDNIWLDIPNMMHVPKIERTGYPTQKPEALLERILDASSKEGDTILDPFCGCGTTLVVSALFNRNFIGIDISRMAIKVMENRLKEVRNRPGVHAFEFKTVIPRSISAIKDYDWRNFQDWVCEKLGAYKGKPGADKGIDGITYHQNTIIHDTVRRKQEILPEGTLIQTKHFAHGTIGEPHLKKFESTIRQHKKTEGLMIGWDFSNQAILYSIDAEKRGITIYLMTADELFKLETMESPYKKDYKVDRQKRVYEYLNKGVNKNAEV